jgi:peptide/nickel transport system permease protein
MSELRPAPGTVVEPGGGLAGELFTATPRPVRRSRLRIGLSGAILLVLYASAALAPWIAPYEPGRQHRRAPNAPPMRVHLYPPSAWTTKGLLYVHPQRMVDSLRRRYQVDTERRMPLRLFAAGHLFQPADPEQPVFLLGSDALGRDLFSRLVYGSRVSLSIGVVGVLISLGIGTIVGVVAGYLGGRVDNLLMRLCEVMMSLPAFYFLLALAAVIPPGLSSAQTFLLIVVLMSFIRWAGFARVIRGMVTSIRELEYVQAARALGAGRARTIVRHVVPATLGYTIVAATLAIPGFILGESALSLLGLGIQEPSTSWGSLLKDANNLANLDKYPWILAPGVCIAVTTMAFNFLGDQLRDRLDPRAGQTL